MGTFSALAKKEMLTGILHPAVLFAAAFFALLDSFAFFLIVSRPGGGYAVFDEMALFMLFTAIFLYPLVSMNAFSEENAEGTLETLLTAPVGHFSAIAAKFTACLAFVAVSLLPGLVYAVLLDYGGNLDWRATAAAFLALFAVGALAMAIGIFISALTVSPAAAAAGSGGVLVFMAISADIDPYGGGLANFLNSLSYVPHAKRWIAGELDTRGLIYFLSAAALFLFYAWLSLGARGQGKRAVTRTSRRRALFTCLLICLGFILLVAQLALFHIKGVWESGTPLLGPTLRRLPWNWFLPAVLSALCFLWSVFTYRAARRSARQAVPARSRKYATLSDKQVLGAAKLYYAATRRSRLGVAIAAVAALAIVLNLNWLAHYPFRTFQNSRNLSVLSALRGRSWDVTQEKRNSLSAETRRVLDGLQGRARIYAFFAADGEFHGVPLAEELRRLFARYGDYNGMVSSAFADPVNDPERAQTLARGLDLPPQGLENRLIVEYQGRRLEAPVSWLASPPDWRAQMAGDTRWVFDGERGVTQALMHLLDPRVPTVFFSYGHREHSIVENASSDRSVSRFARALAQNNMRIRQFILSADQPPPPECDILVVAAPRTPFADRDVDNLRKYLERGGRLLLLAPQPEGGLFLEENDPLNALVFEMGGSVRDDIVYDASRNDGGVETAPLGRLKGSGDGGLAFAFPGSRSIRDNPRSLENGWNCERLVETFPSSVARRMRDGDPRPGPFTMVYRAVKEAEGRESRVVLVSSGRLAADSDIRRGDNESLVVGLAQWLAGREESYLTTPRPWINRRLTLVDSELRGILWLALVALPLAWLLAGLGVWWARKD
ncbi:MAG: Gldg family protein [Planctomycetota bacterium]|jgi:ABC-2 type transport system permease protein|nr:Gldg family protein [Planctomycetota bacterium]